jgi:hypothetical protein
MNHRALFALALAAGMVVLPLAAASGQSKIYPPGTDCANQPTIAERLLCGRQEFRRQSETSVPQPAPLPGVNSEPERVQLPTSPMEETAPLLVPKTSQGGTASAHH